MCRTLGCVTPRDISLRIALLLNRATDALGTRLQRQRGQGLVEYSLILILIAVVLVLIVGVVGKQVKNVFSNVSSGLGA